VQLDVDRDKLPLGDYMWLMLPAGAAPSAADADSEDGEAEERAAAAERAACVLTGAVVERKTMRDLVGRSAAG
jgi:ERCC4-type nuclease